MALLKRKRSFWRAEILSCLRKAGYAKPTLLQQRIMPLILKGRDIAVEAEGGSGKTAAFILPLIMKIRDGKPGIKALVLTHNLESSRKIIREFRKFSSFEKSSPSAYALGNALAVKKEVKPLSSGPDVLIGTPDRVIDHIRRSNIDFKQLQTVIIDKPDGEDTTGFSNDVSFIYSKFPCRKHSILFSYCFEYGQDSLISVLNRPLMIPMSAWKESAFVKKKQYQQFKENTKMQIAKNKVPAQDERIKGLINRTLKIIKEKEDPGELNTLRKIIRKNVPVYLRSYFMTYLFKSTLLTNITTEDIARLFISAGKNQKIFPKDLIVLFTSSLNIDRSCIGEIKILDNYSFIDIPSTYAEQAITVLSGTELKGRPITVNYARKKQRK